MLAINCPHQAFRHRLEFFLVGKMGAVWNNSFALQNCCTIVSSLIVGIHILLYCSYRSLHMSHIVLDNYGAFLFYYLVIMLS
jgi:hypothetical protein